MLLSLHIFSFFFVTWIFFLYGKGMFLWMRGETGIFDAKKLKTYHRRMWEGLFLMIVTGVFLFLPKRDILSQTPAFHVLMFLVFCLLANGLMLMKFMPISTLGSYKSLTKKEKQLVFVILGISLVAWSGAFVTAFFLPD